MEKRARILALAGLCIAFACALLAATPSVSRAAPSTQQKIDSVLILKQSHLLELISDGKVVHAYKVALGRGGLAAKQREGDGLTPEGRYVIDARNEHSHYYKALHISYPNAADRKRAAAMGISPGGAIMIHGLPNGMGWLGASHRLYDWTLGCIAVTDAEMDEIWNPVSIGTPVEIRP